MRVLICIFIISGLLFLGVSKSVSKYQRYRVKAEQIELKVKAEKALEKEEFDKAYDLITRLLRKKPCLLEAEAHELIRETSVRGAIHSMKRNDFFTAYERIGWISHYHQYQEDVSRFMDRVLSQHYEYAHFLYEKGDYQNAIKEFKVILTINPLPGNSREILPSAKEELILCVLGYTKDLLSSRSLPDKALEVLSEVFNYSPLPPHVLNVSFTLAYQGIEVISQQFSAHQNFQEAFFYLEKVLDTFNQLEIRNHIFKKQTQVLDGFFESFKKENKPPVPPDPEQKARVMARVSVINNTQFPLRFLFFAVGANEGFKASLLPGKSTELELWPREYFTAAFCKESDLNVKPHGKITTFMPGGIYKFSYITAQHDAFENMIRSQDVQNSR